MYFSVLWTELQKDVLSIYNEVMGNDAMFEAIALAVMIYLLLSRQQKFGNHKQNY